MINFIHLCCLLGKNKILNKNKDIIIYFVIKNMITNKLVLP